jgi:hypothetical protein
MAVGTHQDCLPAECIATPMCCNTFVFDTCNISVLSDRHDGESASEDGSPRLFLVDAAGFGTRPEETQTGKELADVIKSHECLNSRRLRQEMAT